MLIISFTTTEVLICGPASLGPPIEAWHCFPRVTASSYVCLKRVFESSGPYIFSRCGFDVLRRRVEVAFEAPVAHCARGTLYPIPRGSQETRSKVVPRTCAPN